MTIEPTIKELEFIGAYFECIDFTETGDIDQPESGAELCEVFKRESIIDCLSFYSRAACYLSDDEIKKAGIDFWLTRNGHGAGFWDGDWKVYGKMFDEMARNYGPSDTLFENEIN